MGNNGRLPASSTLQIQQHQLNQLRIDRTPDLLKYAEELRKLGRAKETITNNIQRFQRLAKLCNDINDPEQVKDALTRIKWSNTTKSTAVLSYTAYLRQLGKTWTPPRYIRQEKIYFIPTEQELDQLIAAASKRLTPLLQILKETGMRIGEAYNLAWTDIDLEHKTISVNHPEKGSLPRILPISDKLKGMINNIPRTSDKLFDFISKKTGKRVTTHSLRISFGQSRKRIATQLQNPRLLQIHFHTFRHWKATTMYYKQRDALIIRKILGHKIATMTDRYITIVETLYQNDNDDYISKVVQTGTPTTIQEIQQLAETGFQQFATVDGYQIFRKHK